MAFISKQALCQTINGTLDYISTQNTKIMAFTVHNPTADNVECTVAVNGKTFINKTIMPNNTEMFGALFNQHIGKDERLTMTGDGLNVWLTVLDIIE